MSLERKIRLLHQHPLLTNADPKTLCHLAQEVSFEEIPSGETVIETEQSLTGIYVVAHGRLEIMVAGEKKNERVVKQITRNESFGNLSLITEAPSCCSVRAIVDSLVLKLNRRTLVDEINSNPSFNKMINAQVSNFMRSERERIQPFQGTITSIISAESQVGKSMLGVNLAAVLDDETDESVCVVDFSNRPTGSLEETIITDPGVSLDWFYEGRDNHLHTGDFPVFSVDFPDSVSEGAIRAFLGTLIDEVHFVVVVLPSGYNDITQKILMSSDRLYCLSTDTEDAIYETDLLLNHVKEDLEDTKPPLEVVLNQSTEETVSHRDKISDKLEVDVRYQLPRISDDYVSSFETEPPYVLQHPDHSYSRTVRRIAHEAGKISMGLALGSGAARGLAHIGVVDVLQQEDVEPDMVAGSSMGSLVAAGYALGHSPDRMMRYAQKFSESGGFFRLTDLSLPPNRSILRTTRIRRFLDEIFGDATFDDTEIPLAITVMDLNGVELKVFREGSIAEAIRASVSLPMIFEPYEKNGSTYIDGGVIEPVPVEPLRKEGMNNVVAVNPIPPRTVLKEQQSERLGPREAKQDIHPLIKAILPFGGNNLIDIGMRTIEAIEARLSEDQTANAEVVIDPYLTELSWFDFDEYEMFVEQGRRSAKEKIDDVKALSTPGDKAVRTEESPESHSVPG